MSYFWNLRYHILYLSMFRVFQYPLFEVICTNGTSPEPTPTWQNTADTMTCLHGSVNKIKSKTKKKSEVPYIFVLPHANQIRSELQVKYKRPSSAKTKEKRNLITLLITQLPGHFIPDQNLQCSNFLCSNWTEGHLNTKRSYHTFMYMFTLLFFFSISKKNTKHFLFSTKPFSTHIRKYEALRDSQTFYMVDTQYIRTVLAIEEPALQA